MAQWSKKDDQHLHRTGSVSVDVQHQDGVPKESTPTRFVRGRSSLSRGTIISISGLTIMLSLKTIAGIAKCGIPKPSKCAQYQIRF